MAYHSTQEVLDAIHGQVEKTLGDAVDAVVQFHGTLDQAIDYHFAQSAGTNIHTVVVIGIADGNAGVVTGSGIPLYMEELVDIHVVSRGRRGDYKGMSSRLIEIADALTFDLFDQSNKHQDVLDRVAAHNFVSRRARPTNDPNAMAFLVTWNIKPRRAD
jgi:hypothetical protein